MFKKVLISSLLLISSSYAHTAIMTCFDNGDNTITCEGGFSNGSSGSGVQMYVKHGDKKIIEGLMNEDSEFTFTKPQNSYVVIFDAGKGHIVSIKGEEIIE
ncbi:conserved hypothetical protein [Arcobacter nitrofigilis DSM 7299]|uniref:Uncharacterized protein n=1 Tax=Arcobacter nitrofigilis (strain ATCC 33309 / DSM 7299 / CCUG 15893 / LMG 7604 / NCTC 12251 / CI) TaxID=572480 RepID=D5UZI7_ARCNC|nr:hypothetical protein [Arcobacter nitrofigilis]ADG92224.1 conserved hypothetical protein [Arcobacter nitrofigilis DSM 7299]